MTRQMIGALIITGLVSILLLIWARMEIRKKHQNIRAFIWFRLGAWAFANGDAAVLRAQHSALYKVAANSRADSEGPLDIWGGGWKSPSRKAEEAFEEWKRKSQEEEACPI